MRETEYAIRDIVITDNLSEEAEDVLVQIVASDRFADLVEKIARMRPRGIYVARRLLAAGSQVNFDSNLAQRNLTGKFSDCKN